MSSRTSWRISSIPPRSEYRVLGIGANPILASPNSSLGWPSPPPSCPKCFARAPPARLGFFLIGVSRLPKVELLVFFFVVEVESLSSLSFGLTCLALFLGLVLSSPPTFSSALLAPTAFPSWREGFVSIFSLMLLWESGWDGASSAFDAAAFCSLYTFLRDAFNIFVSWFDC